MNTEFELFPDAASTAAPTVDRLYIFMLWLSLAFTVLIAGLIFYFAIKYRRGNRVDRTQLPTSIRMELSWMIISLPILMFIFVWGAKVAFFLVRPPSDTMPITVVPKQWMWKFQHDNGRREIDVLHVPINQPVRLTMISQDVIHSLFVPAFRVKQDVLPGRYTSLWFEATKPGEYRLYCAEYCGTNHSRMIGRVVAQTPGDFAEWLAGDKGDEPPEVTGAKLFEQFQCATCHAQGGATPARGPALEDLYMKEVALADGSTAIADETYLRESILRPTKKLVAGYQPLMPTFEGQIDEEGVLHLIAYIKSLSHPPPSKGREQPSTVASGDRAQGGSPREANRGGIPESPTPPAANNESAPNANPSPDLSLQRRGESP